MKTYWDFEEKERAALTREDVEKFIDAELMTKGVLKVQPLKLEALPEVPEPTTTVFSIRYGYENCGLVFASAEDAAKVLGLLPMKVNGEYVNGQTLKSLHGLDDAEIVATKMHTKAEIAAFKPELSRKAALVTENDRRQHEYDAATTKQDEVLRGLWEDWHNCLSKAAKMQRIISTFNDYVEAAAGERDVAGVFLLKVFAYDEIAEAISWTGVEIPTQLEPKRAEQPSVERPAEF